MVVVEGADDVTEGVADVAEGVPFAEEPLDSVLRRFGGTSGFSGTSLPALSLVIGSFLRGATSGFFGTSYNGLFFTGL